MPAGRGYFIRDVRARMTRTVGWPGRQQLAQFGGGDWTAADQHDGLDRSD